MNLNLDFIKENRKAIAFLVTFIAIYFISNTIYGFYIQYYYPSSDPFTRLVSLHSIRILQWFDSSVVGYPSEYSEYVAIGNDRENVIDVFEGCNSINVIIVYLSFLISFRGSAKLTAMFTVLGIVGIYLVNLARICLLYGVAFYFPDQLYFFHKYLFTGMIYAFVFVLWYFWVKRVNHEQANR
jgi:exosortase family protein XrtF